MKTKTCYVKKYTKGYGWRDFEHPASSCLVAIAQGYPTAFPDDYLLEKGLLTEERSEAICGFDCERGTDYQLETIKALAKELKVEIVVSK